MQNNAKIIIFSIITLILVGLVGCEKNSTSEAVGGESGTLQISLTDAPGDYDAVNISFSRISAHIDNQWITVVDTARTVNLLDWSNGRTLLIADNEIPAGRYSQVRLIIDSAEVVINGSAYPLDVPSGAKSGLKLQLHFDIVAGEIYQLVVDFDACRSVVETGPPGNPSYKLKPTLRVHPMAQGGSISGTVVNAQNSPIAYAIVENDTVTSALANQFTGDFTLAFLPQGYYTVSVRDNLGLSFSADSIEVIPGLVNDLGNILLQ